MCWALGCGFVLARPASESPELLALDEGAEAPPELLEPELPQAATMTAHTVVMSATAIVAAVLRVIFCTSTIPPAYLLSGRNPGG
jgi:hypothetical protein